MTDRISWFRCGRHLFHDPGYDWGSRLDRQWPTLGMPPPPGMPAPAPQPLVAQAA